MSTYQLKNKTVEAEQWFSYQDTAWPECVHYDETLKTYVVENCPAPGFVHPINDGDWVVKLNNNHNAVMGDGEFNFKYELNTTGS